MPPEILDAAGIAERLQALGARADRDTIRRWSYRHADFPKGLKIGQAWAWDFAAVEAWCRKTERIPS